ncbi:hypothetical protein SISSUDRAFT_309543 [Sistotremastrum suecicum HHB10207 ss-3]|uniref:Uncharacterized protein n=1 Tax=Sistotremastrum suecicum HHB10207 ss-3 TaxID=1314776 RepID=A0A165ZCT7_9AGAM|nr:hypothetical protein SISSUDRAFT_309543 [Sistotremastrum suecicum HHB10207 ss-3]
MTRISLDTLIVALQAFDAVSSREKISSLLSCLQRDGTARQPVQQQGLSMFHKGLRSNLEHSWFGTIAVTDGLRKPLCRCRFRTLRFSFIQQLGGRAAGHSKAGPVSTPGLSFTGRRYSAPPAGLVGEIYTL